MHPGVSPKRGRLISRRIEYLCGNLPPVVVASVTHDVLAIRGRDGDPPSIAEAIPDVEERVDVPGGRPPAPTSSNTIMTPARRATDVTVVAGQRGLRSLDRSCAQGSRVQKPMLKWS